MIKVHAAADYDGSRATSTIDADSFESTSGFLTLRKNGEMIACFAPGHWASVEKEGAMASTAPEPV